MVIAEKPTTHNETGVFSDRTDTNISRPIQPEIVQDNSVDIDGIKLPSGDAWTQSQIAIALDCNPTTLSKIIAKLEQEGEIEPIVIKVGRKSTRQYSLPVINILIPRVLSIKKRPRPSKYGESDLTGKKDEQPFTFFIFPDGTRIQGIDQKQIALLELVMERANQKKLTTLKDLREKSIIDDKSTPDSIKTLFTDLSENIENQTHNWKFVYNPNYVDPNTAKKVFAFTILKTEPIEETRNKHLSKKKLAKLREQVLKHAVLDLLDEIIQSKTDINYNVKLRLYPHLPHGKTIKVIFEDASHQDLNDAFIEAFESELRKFQQPNPKKSKNGYNSQPDPVDLQIQERFQTTLNKKVNIQQTISYFTRRLGYQAPKTNQDNI